MKKKSRHWIVGSIVLVVAGVAGLGAYWLLLAWKPRAQPQAATQPNGPQTPNPAPQPIGNEPPAKQTPVLKSQRELDEEEFAASFKRMNEDARKREQQAAEQIRKLQAAEKERRARLMKEHQERMDKFHAALKMDADAIPLCLELARGVEKNYQDIWRTELNAAIGELAERYQDPRVEAALEQIQDVMYAKHIETHGPPDIWELDFAHPDPLRTLLDIRVKKRYKEVLDGAVTGTEKIARIRSAVEAHPDWLVPAKRLDSVEESLLARLLDTAEVEGGTGVIDLLVRGGWFSPFREKQLEKYSGAILGYLKRHGAKKTLANNRLVRLFEEGFSGLPGKAPAQAAELVDAWLKEKEADTVGLLGLRSRLPGAREILLKYLADDRDNVVRTAVVHLRLRVCDDVSLAAIKELAERRRRAGAPQEELDYYTDEVNTIQANIQYRAQVKHKERQ